MNNPNSTRISHSYDNDPLVLLNLRRLPARVNYRGAAALLNFEPVAIRTLVALGLLEPLGNPQSTKHKYFSSITLLKLSEDEKWLDDATSALMNHWAQKNARRGTGSTVAGGIHLLPPKSSRSE
jgi:hypothetical protein